MDDAEAYSRRPNEIGIPPVASAAGECCEPRARGLRSI
jgi:hypothetical protein